MITEQQLRDAGDMALWLLAQEEVAFKKDWGDPPVIAKALLDAGCLPVCDRADTAYTRRMLKQLRKKFDLAEPAPVEHVSVGYMFRRKKDGQWLARATHLSTYGWCLQPNQVGAYVGFKFPHTGQNLEEHEFEMVKVRTTTKFEELEEMEEDG